MSRAERAREASRGRARPPEGRAAAATAAARGRGARARGGPGRRRHGARGPVLGPRVRTRGVRGGGRGKRRVAVRRRSVATGLCGPTIIWRGSMLLSRPWYRRGVSSELIWWTGWWVCMS